MAECTCDFATGECQAPAGCKAVAEIERLRAPWEGVMADDWAYILSLPGDGGRGRFWKDALRKMRVALEQGAADK